MPPDIRLVIDVSGSMKQNDPNNLRQPAVDLLVQLLPENSKAGIWTFGRWVNMLVKHQSVDQAWRKNAVAKSDQINSVGLNTNIGEALEKAAYDIEHIGTEHRTSIVLLTDGMVDIDKEPEKNKREWRRIVDEVLPKLKQAGITIHTVALSDNADTDLLNKLSLGTDGIAAVAKSADELMKIFLKAFDAAAPLEQVPLSDDGFVIDSSVEEFTALIFRSEISEETQLIGPDEEVYTAASHSKYINWHRAKNYDLITVKQPLEGQWDVIAVMDPESRITVVSNLNIRVQPLPNNVFKDQSLNVSFVLQEDGSTITRPEFLSLMDITATIQAGKDEFELQELWREEIANEKPPGNGSFSIELPAFSKEGVYQLSIVVDGKSFVREFNHQFTTRQPFGADIKQRFDEGSLEYVLTVRSYNSDVVVNKTQVVATIVSPDGRKKIRPLSPTDLDTWQTEVRPDLEGEYLANVKVKGEAASGDVFDLDLEALRFNYSIDGGFVEQETPFFEEQPETTTTPVPEATPSPEATPEQQPVVTEKPGSAMPTWVLYVVLGAGNLLLLGLGYLIFKKVMDSSRGEAILEQFSEDKIVQELPEEPVEQEDEPVQEDVEEEEEEEPPMEDLDPSDDDIEPAPVMEESVAEPELEEEADHSQTLATPTETAELTEADDDPMDALDDLDQMAVETASDDGAEEIELDEEEEEEDMVSAMLKAQGLDLAEDELDDAISSLIDELESDDTEGEGTEDESDEK